VAKSAFETASGLKPEEQYPKDKIAELTALIGQAAELENNYKEAVKMGDEGLAAKELDIAKTAYEKAAALKPNEAYPKEKLAEIQGIIDNEAKAIELANKAQKEYDDHVAKADAAMAKSEFETARSGYQAALGIKPEEAYPKDQLTKIDEQIAALEAQASEEEAARKKREAYDAHIATADNAFEAKTYDVAVTAYEAAKGVLPEETYPDEQLTKIQGLRASEAEAIELANRALNEKYGALIATADEAFNANNLEVAETNYRAALEVKLEEKYPQDQIAKISDLKSAASAQEKEYQAFITNGDKAFKSEDFEAAKTAYQSALSVKPGEEYPTTQLAEIDRRITEAASNAEKEKKEAEALAKEKQYNEFIATADNAFKSAAYANAKTAYSSALGVKPGEEYPTTQLAEIDRLIAEAASNAEAEKLAAAAKEKEKQFNDLIAAADKSFKSAAYQEAKSAYQSALEIKPAEAYPAAQLVEIDRLIAEAASNAENEKRAAAEKAKEEQYNNLIATADKSFKGKDFETARTNYNAALEVKPAEQYPKTQLEEIDRLIAEAAAIADRENLEAEAKAKEKQYKELIAAADKSFKSAAYQEAKSNYQKALALKSGEQHPTDRLVEIEGLLSTAAAAEQKEVKYKELIAKADADFKGKLFEAAKGSYEKALGVKAGEEYPQKQLLLIEEELSKLAEQDEMEAERKRKMEAKYANFIIAGDKAFEEEKYQAATEQYKAALGIKTTEQYPQDQINKISELLAKQSENDEAAAARKAMLAEYDQKVLRGDKAFAAKNYREANEAYRAALSIQPEEGYPKKKLKEISDILDQQREPVVAKVEEPKPRAKVSGKSEDDIAAMMAEMVRKREEAKAERIRKLKQDVVDAEDGRVMDANGRREEARVEIAELEEEVMKISEAKKELYAQQVEKMEVYTEQVTETQVGYVENANDRRDGQHDALNQLAADIQASNQKGNELHLLSAERIATLKIEQDQTANNYVKNGDERREEAQALLDEVKEDQQNMKDAGEDKRLQKAEEFATYEKALAKEENRQVNTADKRRIAVDNENKRLADEIKTWNTTLDGLHYQNAEQVAKTEKEIIASRQQQEKAAIQRGDNNYASIQEYKEQVTEITQEKNNQYEANNQKIQERSDEVTSYQQQLTKEADARRDGYDVTYYQGEKQPRKSEDASKYPQGVTEETYEEGNSIVVKRFVVTGETLDEYEKIYYTWGGVFYKKNGQDITAAIWDKETK
jgi:hypothetical protein